MPISPPWCQHYGWVQPLTLPNGRATRTVTDPLGKAVAARRSPPALGEHAAEILEEVRNARPEPFMPRR